MLHVADQSGDVFSRSSAHPPSQILDSIVSIGTKSMELFTPCRPWSTEMPTAPLHQQFWMQGAPLHR
eukprot:870284-Amphidinium_carterae.1